MLANLAQASGQIGKLSKPSNANAYDQLILFWTKYWNEIFSSEDRMDPNVVKALIDSESSFREGVKDQRVKGKNFARGLLQITDETRMILGDEAGELKDHFLTLSKDDVRDPDIRRIA